MDTKRFERRNEMTEEPMTTDEFIRAHAPGDNDAALSLFVNYGHWRFGSILWARESLLGQRCPEWTVRSDRKCHPVLTLAFSAPQHLDERFPVLIGSSSYSDGSFPVKGVTADGRITYFKSTTLAWVTPLDLMWRASDLKQRIEAWPWEVYQVWPCERLSRLPASRRDDLRSYLRRRRLCSAALLRAVA